jgi:hypothetical protein
MFPQNKFQRSLGFSMKVMRLSTFAAVVGGVVTVFGARSVYGSATESVFHLNQEWSQKAGALDKQSYRVRFNGQSMMTSSHMVDESVKAALDDAEEECKAKSGGIEKDLAHLPQFAAVKLSSFIFGTVRRDMGDMGFVACFERDGDRGISGLSEDLTQVARTGDIGKFGTFHYTSVDRRPGTTKTHVLRQWTDGSFNLGTLFPANGDAPGSDLPEVTRPDGSRRILDASVDGSHFGVRVYDAPETPAAVLARYDHDLAPKGWTRVDLTEKEAATTRVYDQEGGDLFITATPSSNGRRTTVSVASMPAAAN